MNRLSTLLVLLCCAAPALAHDTVSAGGVSITMFTDAGDKLRLNADTPVIFELQHAGKSLALQSCRCTLLVYPGTPSARLPPLLSLPLKRLPDGRTGALVNVTVAGAYTLVLDGRPLRSGSFDAFRVQYSLPAAVNVFGN